MANATPTGETRTPAAPKTDATPPVTPTVPKPEVKAEDNAAVEQLKKELEQQRMRANQLENEKKAREDAEAKRKADELAEQNQFKDLYEQEKAKREGLETEAEARERLASLEKAKQEVLKDYNDEVRALAEEVGLDLTDADENAVNAFKEKLDKINTRVSATGKVTGNNQPNATPQPELSVPELRKALSDEHSFHDLVVAKFPGIASMTNQRKS